MIRRFLSPLLAISGFVTCGLYCSGKVVVSELEKEFGPLQGQMAIHDQTVLLFQSAKVRVFHDTGKTEIEQTGAEASSLIRNHKKSLPDLRMIKRRIARLPAYEQVRYWKLHQIRYPDQDVSEELHASLDLMDEIRKQSLEEPEEKEAEESSIARYYPRNRHYSTYTSSFGYSSYYRHRRARHEDAELEREYRRERGPVEEWTTAMSLADRARSDAYGKISGARSVPLSSGR
ncbi:MAG: hypothetical protein KJT03_12880 [Verrucomicrobiae bacterium]|nr:hypothetical protein [Verrucomicrobiae bacterium]